MPDEQNRPTPDRIPTRSCPPLLATYRNFGFVDGSRLNWEVGHVHAADAVQPVQALLNRAVCAYEPA